MAVAENRVEKAMERIEDGLKRMRSAMADVRNIDRVIKHEKARLIDSVILKYLNTTDPDERMQLGVLKRSRHQLMKEANPGMLNRIFPEISSTIRSVLDFFKDKAHREKVAVQSVQQKQEAAFAQEKLIKHVAEKGFPEVAVDIRSGIKRGEDSFVVKWSVYKRENEKIEYDLHFKRDDQGKYNFEKVQATWKDKNKNLIRKLSVDMDGEMSFSPQQIYNLMCGRAVQLGGLKYIIDPNDMGADGNNTLRPSVASGDKFTAMLAELPFMQNKTPEQVQQTAGILLGGGNVPMDITLQGQQRNFFMEANSQHTGLNYFDENGVKTSLSLLFPAAGGIILPDNNLTLDQIARNALKYGNDQNRDFFERTLNQAADHNKMQQQSRKGSKSMSH